MTQSTLEQQTPQWQTQVSSDLDQVQNPRLRISSAGRCPRQLAYAHLGTPESNPPDQHSLNRMAMGHMAEVLIIRNMQQAGWETDHTVLSPSGQLELNMQLQTNLGNIIHFTGHPDGICRHPNFTSNMWVTLECKSMSKDMGVLVEEHGIALTYPKYIVQIGLYGRILYQEGLVSHPHRGVFGLMDRDGAPIAPQRTKWEDDVIDKAIQTNLDAVNATEVGELPDRPYEVSSTECKQCPYHTLCWGQGPPQLDPPKNKEKVVPEDPKVIKAIQDWADMEPRMTEVKGILESASRTSENADLILNGVTAGYFLPIDPPSYNANKLKDLVPADILNQCRIPAPQPRNRFWIRKDRY